MGKKKRGGEEAIGKSRGGSEISKFYLLRMPELQTLQFSIWYKTSSCARLLSNFCQVLALFGYKRRVQNLYSNHLSAKLSSRSRLIKSSIASSKVTTCWKLNNAGYWILNSRSSTFWLMSFLRWGKVSTILCSTLLHSGVLSWLCPAATLYDVAKRAHLLPQERVAPNLYPLFSISEAQAWYLILGSFSFYAE